MYTQYLGTGKSLEWVCSYSSKLLGKYEVCIAYNSKEVELLDGTVLTISKQRKTEVCKLFRVRQFQGESEIHRKLIR